MDSSLAHAYLQATQLLKGQKLFHYLLFLEKTQWWSRKALVELQWRRLKRTLFLANEKIPFYKHCFQKYALHPSKIKTRSDFQKLPLLEKSDLLRSIEKLKDPFYSDRVTQGSTSGSTGLATRVYYDNFFHSSNLASQWRGRRWHGVNVGDPIAVFWGRPIYSAWRRLAYALKSRLQNLMVLNPFEFTEADFENIYKKIKKFAPKLIYGYAQTIYLFAKYLEQKKIVKPLPHLKAVIYTAENLFVNQKKLVESVFQCPVVTEYGSSENGAFAFTCTEGKMHISVENVWVEVVDSAGTPLPVGKQGEIVVTNLNNAYMPLIRYRLGDVGALIEGECRCGRGLPLMDLKVGKTTEYIETKKGKQLSSQIFEYINLSLMQRGIRGIAQFKVIQKNDVSFDLLIVKGFPFEPRAVQYFIEKLKEYLGEVIVNVIYVPRISPSPSGKISYFERRS